MDDFIKLSNKICVKCKADCCRIWNVFLSEYDKQRIKKINKGRNLFDGNYFNTKRKYCPFYDIKNKKCTIHKYRPLDCRLYPYSFWFEQGKIELWLDLKCPMAKELVENKKFYNQALKMAKKELVHWSEGEIFAYLMSDFDIKEFKKQAKGSVKKYYKK